MGNKGTFSHGVDPKIIRPGRNKMCYCGCHSAHHVKKNKHHHATFIRESIRKIRKAIKKLENDSTFYNIDELMDGEHSQ